MKPRFLRLYQIALQSALILGLFSTTSFLAAAQSSPFDWSYPQRITQGQDQISEPFLVADQSGLLHLFWSPYSSDFQSLYYSQSDGKSWSEPVDIFSESRISGPSAVVDSKGIIHLIWGDGLAIYYSQAPVDQATSARSWMPSITIASGFSHARILVDDQDRLYVVFPGLASTGPEMITSEDSGLTWSGETAISYTNSLDAAADYVQAAMSSNGKIHVVWTEYQLPQAWPPLGLYYSNSDDGGVTWSRAQQLASGNYNQINLATFGDQVIHVAWNGAAGTGGRYHRWSQDGGQTWSTVNTLVQAGLGGSEGPPQLAVDNLGTLHLTTSVDDQRIWYGYFQGQRWSELVYIPSGDETGIPPVGQTIDTTTQRHVAYPTMSINAGNQLHLVFWDERPSQQKIQYWYTSKQTSASPVPFLPFPTPSPTPTLAATPDAMSTGPKQTIAANASVLNQTPDLNKNQKSMNTGTGWPVIIATIPVFMLIGLIVVQKMARRSRR